MKAADEFKVGNAVATSFKAYDEIVMERHTPDQCISSHYAANKFGSFLESCTKKYGKKNDWHRLRGGITLGRRSRLG